MDYEQVLYLHVRSSRACIVHMCAHAFCTQFCSTAYGRKSCTSRMYTSCASMIGEVVLKMLVDASVLILASVSCCTDAPPMSPIFFFLNDAATPKISPLPLPDAFPI